MKILHTTLIIATIGLFTSCTVLTPSGPNVPLFKEKGEKMVNANFIAGEQTLGVEVKGAIATSDHFYLGGNVTVVSFGDGTYGNLTPRGSSTGYMTELGAGGFGKIGNDGIFDMSGGIGFGSSFSDQLLKIYIQPAIGFRREKVEFATGLKATYLNSEGVILDDEVRINSFILEPFMMGRFGGKKTKFQAGINFPTVVATDGLSGMIPNLTLGVIFRFGKAK
jgi:hypothetical protein